MSKNGRGRILPSIKKYILRNYRGWLYVFPVVLGVLIFTLYPMISSLYDSFFKYNVLKPRQWNNFKIIFIPLREIGKTFLAR